MRVLALDVGSSSARALAYDERGREVEGTLARRAYEPVYRSDGSAELDPDLLVTAAREALDEAAAALGGAADGVAISCFWHSFLLLDERRPLTSVLLWQDRRAAPQAERLAGRLDGAAIHARTGSVVHPSYWPAKLAWLVDERPDLLADARHAVSFAEYLFLQLTGELRMTLSSASGTGLLDVGTRAWDRELLDAIDLDPALLPPLSDDPAGAGRPLFPPLGDGACSNLGAGCTDGGRAALMIGTSGAYRVLHRADRPEARPGLFCYLLDAGRIVRAPGAVSGLTFHTGANDLYRAALEGVVYRLAEVATLLPEVREVVATGHALLASPEWIQLCADVLGRPVAASAVAEGSARGAAVYALERLGAEPEPAPNDQTYEPDPERTERHAAARE